MTISADSQQPDPGARVDLFELDATLLGGEVHRFTPSSDQPITFGGLTFVPMPVSMTGLGWTGEGAPPEPTLMLSLLDEQGQQVPLVPALLAGLDLRGATLRRIETFARYLDGEPEADATQHYPVETWRIERKVRQDKAAVQYALSSPVDQQGVILPRRRVTRFCPRPYRRYDPANPAADANGFVYSSNSFRCPYGVDRNVPGGNVFAVDSQFNASLDGWWRYGFSTTLDATSLTLTATIANPRFFNTGLAVDASANTAVVFRLRRTALTGRPFLLRWDTGGGMVNELAAEDVTDATFDDWFDLTFDLAGVSAWAGTVQGVELQFATEAGATFGVDRASIFKPGFFGRSDQPVVNAADDFASKTLRCCEKRFPRPQALPHGGFPGASR